MGKGLTWRKAVSAIGIGALAGFVTLPLVKGKEETLENRAVVAQEAAPRYEGVLEKQRTSYKTNDFSEDSDEVLLARMIFGEARGCFDEEKIAVAYTAVNRLERDSWYGKTLREVLLKPWQYSCFNKNDPNRKKLMDPEKYDERQWRKCLEISKKVLSGKYSDPTLSSTHYFRPGAENPAWAEDMKKIGRIQTKSGLTKQEFYRE